MTGMSFLRAISAARKAELLVGSMFSAVPDTRFANPARHNHHDGLAVGKGPPNHLEQLIGRTYRFSSLDFVAETIFASGAEDETDWRAWKGKFLSDPVFQISLISEVYPIGLIYEKNEGRRIYRRLGNIGELHPFTSLLWGWMA